MKSHVEKLIILTLICLVVPLTRLWAAAPTTADAIMEKVDFNARKSYTSKVARIGITTCKYAVRNGKVSCTEKPRIVNAMSIIRVKMIDDLHNTNSLMVVETPALDKGLSLLVYEYGERGRENDNWIYTPAIGKVNRVIANDDSAGSVFGSEFSVESVQNPDARKIHEYTYELLAEATYQGRPTWVIEMTPTPEKARRISWAKVVAWIDQETYVALKEELYRSGEIYKQRTQSEIKNIDGVYVPTKVIINNLQTQRITYLDNSVMRHNWDVPEALVAQRTLTDAAYREPQLDVFRTRLQGGGGLGARL